MHSVLVLMSVVAAPAVAPPTPSLPKVRVLILRHTRDKIAVHDSKMARDAVNEAAKKGLDVKIVGSMNVTSMTIGNVREIVELAIEKDASPGDTFIVHTIGHGLPNGQLVELGLRTGVLEAIKSAAEKHKQRTVWWQLSCFACAGLPKIDHDYLTIISSSPATHPSVVSNQAILMKRMFVAIATMDGTIDINGDKRVSTDEIREFLNGQDKLKRGELVFGRDSIVFGKHNCPIYGPAGRAVKAEQLKTMPKRVPMPSEAQEAVKAPPPS